MIVTCERCTTQFQLDDSRIPPGGVRVRCSRCKHAFEISLPESGREDPDPGETLPDLPAEAPEEGGLWGASEDLDAPAAAAAVAPSEPGAFAQRSALSEPASSSLLGDDEESSLLADDSPDDEESDWEFNEDLPAVREPEGGDAADVVDQFLRSPRSRAGGADATPYDVLSASPSGLDLADEPDPEPEPEPEPGLALQDEEADESEVPELARAPAASPSSLAGDDPAESVADELGVGEDWDLFGSEGEESSAPLRPAVRLPAPVEASDDPIQRPAWVDWTSRAGGLVGWVAVSALFALGLLSGLPQAARMPAQLPSGTLGDLELTQASGVWIDNAVAGPIYLISGRLRNAGPLEVEAPALAIELLDGEGRMVMDLPVPLEAPHSRRNLRELAPSELSHGRAPGSGRPLAPGASVDFEAVLAAVPREATSYRLVDAPPSLRRSPPGAPRRERRDGPREMIAEGEAPDAPGPSAGERSPAGSPASLAP